ncbi:hypothetical protein QP575_10285 [Alcaligenes faecalis subsp. phenolicus]|uniref:hypothetical protein n=1 Tax=Alcaligenes nematophilus TaxID=2994643 RepID=UPI002AA4EF34|nr:hypothetical protein [Alcaligenes phenolicus]
MESHVIKTEADRRGRIYAAGVLVGHEDEAETFRQLAKKYLFHQELKEVALLTDPPQIRFRAAETPVAP